jgi:anti-sigma factor RsiW
VELLIDYVSGEMSESERAILRQHLDKCPPCLVYMETYQTTIRLTQELPREAPIPPELEERLLAAARSIKDSNRTNC